MHLIATGTYIIIIGLWTTVLWIIAVSYRRIPPNSGALHLLLAVMAIDATRNIIENVYFGLYFGGQFGFIGNWAVDALGKPAAIFIPKIINVIAACIVISLLLRRWLPETLKERNIDQATGLPNQRRLESDLAKCVAPSQDPTKPEVAVAVFEIHGYRDITDGLGHIASTTLKLIVSKRLKALAPPSTEEVYSLGEGELALVFPSTSSVEVIGFLEDALKALREHLDINGQQTLVEVSAGVVFPNVHQSPESKDILSNARLACRDASLAGGGYYSIYSFALAERARSRIQLEIELQQAHVKRQFVLHYQPQVRLMDGKLVGAEALLRWRHPTRGLLSPAEFIDALSDSPVAPEVGQWILRSACTQGAAWQAAGHPELRMGVNLFPCQFYNEQLARDVERIQSETGISAGTLEIEITENVVLDSDDAAHKTMIALRAIGVGLAVDDFGTGHASLMHLARFPLTRIKIDKNFIADITAPSNQKAKALVKAIIAMTHNLDLEVIAEGLETIEQATVLKEEGCHEGQGYLYSPALDVTAFEKYMTQYDILID